MFRWGGLAIALTGCAQLFGIDETSKATDAQVPTVSLQIERVSIGRTVQRAPQDLSAASMTASWLVPDATMPGGLRKVTSTLTGTDTWVAPLDAPAPVQFESPEVPTVATRILDLPNAQVKTIVPVFERPMYQPAPANPTVTVNASLPTAQAAESYQLFTIGAWTNVGLPAPGAGAVNLATGPVMVTVNNAPQKRLDKITTEDMILVLRYSGNQLVGHLDATPFDQTGTDTISGAIAATTRNEMLSVTVNQAQVASRFSTVRPAVAGVTMQWVLRAAPGLDLNIDFGPLLHAANVLATDPTTVTAMYGNPFATILPTVLLWSTAASRTYTIPGGTLAATLRAGMFERHKPSAGLALTLPAGLPDRITANDAVLNVDGGTVMAPADKPVDVSFITDAASNTLYAVEVFELVSNGTAYVPTKTLTAVMSNPKVAIPREQFKASTYYTIRAITFQGCFTAVASGDLSQMSLPCAQAFVDSGVFQVVTP